MANILEISDKVCEYMRSKENLKGDLTISETESNEITVKDGKFTLFRTLIDNEISIKVIKDNKYGTTKLNKCNEEAIIAAVDDAIRSAESADADECYDIAPGLEPAEYKLGVLEPDIDRLMERTKELSETIATRFKKIKLMEMYTKYHKGKSVFVNTNGTKDVKDFGYYEIFLEFAGNDGESSTGVMWSAAIFDSLDKDLITLGNIEKDLTDAERSLNPMKISDKFEGEILLTPSCVSMMLNIVTANTVSDSAIIEKTSVWLDKVGEQVASPLLTISSKPWDERIIDHEVHTEDGFRSEDYTLIDKGVLKCFATSLYASNKCGVNRAANSATDLIVEPGDTPYEDIIKGMKKGLIVGAVSAGRPGANGELAGVAKRSFYVENGEIKGAVIETMISGNLFDMLGNVKAVSKEQVCDGTMAVPYILVDKVTISGGN